MNSRVNTYTEPLLESVPGAPTASMSPSTASDHPNSARSELAFGSVGMPTNSSGSHSLFSRVKAMTEPSR